MRTRIVHLSPEALGALAAGDLAAATRLTGLPLTPYTVSDERIAVWKRRATQVVERPEDQPWVTGILVDDESGAVVGGAGFHGAPDADGMVEVGYGIAPRSVAAATPGPPCCTCWNGPGRTRRSGRSARPSRRTTRPPSA